MKTQNTKGKNPQPLSIDRRSFLKFIGVPALAAAMPGNIAKLVAAPARRRTGTINDVQHVIILTQENRSFDHYFGTLQGVRGFADPRVMQIPSGQPVWQQPHDGGYVLPFRPPVDNLGLTFLPDPPHGWRDGHSAWNEGKFNQWIANKGVGTMTYHRRSDIPYHAALADAFTVCDAYHCSVMGPTDPNRYHLWTGWLGNNGTKGPDGDPTTGEGPVITNAELGYAWSTYPERLQRNGISWKIYQDTGVGLTAEGYWGWTGDKPFIGNYGDNSLLYFHQYQNAPDGSPLALGARTGTTLLNLNQDPTRLMDIFREDVRRGQLPQVSWIVAPESYSEHPNWAPNWGAWYISQLIDILAANPELWSKTVLFLNYDEEGGFFDHVVPPTPPMSPAHGASTVSTAEEIFPGAGTFLSGPYGLGLRVPMIVISPWSKGGFVNSQVFDHTSVIKFLEARFGQGNPDLLETNITEWRRSVVGDLTSAFDFAHPEAWRLIALPPTDGYLPDFQRHDDYPAAPPADQTMPGQERGVRPARALPYDLDATGSVGANQFQIEFSNVGAATAVFQARSGNPADVPRCYTVEPGAALAGTWPLTANNAYDVSVHGPNGFFRSFKGGVLTGSAQLAIETFKNGRTGEILESGRTAQIFEVGLKDEILEGGQSKVIFLSITNNSGRGVTVRVFDRYAGKTVKQLLANGEQMSGAWNVERFGGWYELVVTVDEDNQFEYRLAGHVEDGKDSISDPLMGGLV